MLIDSSVLSFHGRLRNFFFFIPVLINVVKALCFRTIVRHSHSYIAIFLRRREHMLDKCVFVWPGPASATPMEKGQSSFFSSAVVSRTPTGSLKYFYCTLSDILHPSSKWKDITSVYISCRIFSFCDDGAHILLLHR